MRNIYEQHAITFRNVTAYAVMKDGQHVATIAFKFPKDSSMNVYVYVRWLGLEMVRGHAGGYGYDKTSAACVSAARKLYPQIPLSAKRGEPLWDFYAAIKDDNGYSWETNLLHAGFQVIQAL